MKISAVILTKNEEANIFDCLKSVEFCDEVIVIDDYSTDKTRSIAKRYATRVIKRKLNDNWAKQRNFGLEKAKNDWVLFIDADERVSKNLKNEIKKLKYYKYSGYLLKRRDYLWGGFLSTTEAGKMKILRLANKQKGSFKRKVHEYWDIKGDVGCLSSFINHYPHQTVFDFVKSINKMSSIHAMENLNEGKRSTVFKIIFYPIFKFVKNYIFLKGFKDKDRGLMISFLMSLHSFLAWSKLWFYQKK